MRATVANLDKLVLLHDILHVLLLLLLADGCFLHLGDLLGDVGQVASVLRSEGERTHELGVRVFEGLVLFAANTLTRREEVEAKEAEVAFVGGAGVLDGADVERNRATHDGQDDRVIPGVGKDDKILHLRRQLCVVLVRLEALELLLDSAVHAAGILGIQFGTLPLLLLVQLLLVLASSNLFRFVLSSAALSSEPCLLDV